MIAKRKKIRPSILVSAESPKAARAKYRQRGSTYSDFEVEPLNLIKNNIPAQTRKSI
jgi:hypothetical protein